MDNLDLVLDMTERPDGYSPERVAEIMSHREPADAYELLCRVCGAAVLNAPGPDEADVDAEWRAFCAANGLSPRRRLPLGRRRLSVAAMVAAVCVGLAGAAAGVVMLARHSAQEPAAEAAVEPATAVARPLAAGFASEAADTVAAGSRLVFDNAPLDSIMQAMAARYGVSVRYADSEVASLPMFYIFDSSLPLGEAVDRLNTFGRINIAVCDSVLEVSGQ